jgi:hypothetical protein
MTNPKPKRGSRPLPPNYAESPLVWGAVNIAKHLNRTPQMVYAMHRASRLPIRAIGGVLVAKKSDLSDPATWPRPDSSL